MVGYLLDTNHLSDAITPVSHVREKIYQACREGNRVGTCLPVLFELEVGIQQTSNPERYRRTLEFLLEKVRVWPLDRNMVRLYGELYLELRDRGRVLSQVDMMLVAMARSMGLTLLTADRDFEAVPGIHVENWRDEPTSTPARADGS
jgi:tRNA(fMet)-specific endonuclease VapC